MQAFRKRKEGETKREGTVDQAESSGELSIGNWSDSSITGGKKLRYRVILAIVAIVAASALALPSWSQAKNCKNMYGSIPNGATKRISSGTYIDGDVVIDGITVAGKRIRTDRAVTIQAPNGASWVTIGCQGKNPHPIVRYPGDPIFRAPATTTANMPTTTTPNFTPLPTTIPCGGFTIPVNTMFNVGPNTVLDGDFLMDGVKVYDDDPTTALRTYVTKNTTVTSKFGGWMTTKGCETPLKQNTQVVFW